MTKNLWITWQSPNTFLWSELSMAWPQHGLKVYVSATQNRPLPLQLAWLCAASGCRGLLLSLQTHHWSMTPCQLVCDCKISLTTFPKECYWWAMSFNSVPSPNTAFCLVAGFQQIAGSPFIPQQIISVPYLFKSHCDKFPWVTVRLFYLLFSLQRHL